MIQMQLYEKLSTHNIVYDPKQGKDNDEFLDVAQKCLTTEVYYIIGTNKIEPNLEQAIWRARNIAHLKMPNGWVYVHLVR